MRARVVVAVPGVVVQPAPAPTVHSPAQLRHPRVEQAEHPAVPFGDVGVLLAQGQVKRMVSSYVGENGTFERQYLDGTLAFMFAVVAAVMTSSVTKTAT